MFFEGSRNVVFNYADVMFGGSCVSRDRGGSATIGIQNSSTVSRQFSFNAMNVSDSTALLWTLPAGALSGFTDDPLSAGSTVVKAVHITELRARVNTLRARFGLAAFSWTDASAGAGTIARGIHLTELRSALEQAYTAAGPSAPVFSDLTVTPRGTAIRAVHVTELRNAVLTLEAQ